MTSPPVQPSATTRWSYAAGSIGSGLFSTVPGVLLLFFLTQTVRIPSIMAGLVLLLPKVLGLIADPVIGRASDRMEARFGRRFPFLLAGAIGMSLSFVMLFNTPAFANVNARFVFAMCAYLMMSLSYSAFAVPYVTIPAEIRGTAADRTALIGLRMAFLFVGTILGAAVPPLLVSALGGDTQGYGRMSFVIAAISLPAMLAAAAATRRLELQGTRAESGKGTWRSLATPFRDPAFRQALVPYVLLMIASAATTSTLPYLVTFVLGRPASQVGLLLLVALAIAAVSAPVWPRLSHRFGNAASFVTAIGLTMAGSVLLLLCDRGVADGILWSALVLFGIGSSGIQVCAFAELAAFTSSAGGSGGASASTTGLWTGFEKLGLAFGPALTSLALAASGFEPSAPSQSDFALLGIRAAIGCTPLIMALGAAALILRRRTNERTGATGATT